MLIQSTIIVIHFKKADDGWILAKVVQPVDIARRKGYLARIRKLSAAMRRGYFEKVWSASAIMSTGCAKGISKWRIRMWKFCL